MADGRLVGIVTRTDVMSAPDGTHTVRDVASHDVVSIGTDETALTALHTILDEGVDHLPVIGEDDRLVGIVTRTDIMRARAEAARAATRRPPATSPTKGPRMTPRASRPTDADYERLLAFRAGLRRFLHWSEQQAAAAGLTPAHHQLMRAIRGHTNPDGPTIADVADALLLRHHSASNSPHAQKDTTPWNDAPTATTAA